MADALVVSGIELDARDTLREIRRLDRRMRRLEGQVDQTTASTRRSERGFRSMAGAIAGAAAAFGAFRAADRARRFIFQTNVEFEKLEATLKTVTGSTEAAASAFEMITDFAKTTPFQITELVDSFTQLRVRGVEPTTERLRGLGNFAAAFTEDFGRLTNAIVSGSAGVTRSLRRSFGLDIRKDGEELNVVFEDLERTIPATADALSELLAEIGNTRFVGAMEERMESLDGKISNLEDVAQLAAKSVGEEGLNDAIQDLVGTLEEAISENEEFAESLGQNLASGVRAADGALQLFVEHTEAIIRALEVLVGIVAGRGLLALGSQLAGAAAGARTLSAALLGLTGGPAAAIASVAGIIGVQLIGKLLSAQSETEKLADELERLSTGAIAEGPEAVRSRLGALREQERRLKSQGARFARARNIARQAGTLDTGLGANFRANLENNRAALSEVRQEIARLEAALEDLEMAQGESGAAGSTREHSDAVEEFLASLREERDKLKFSREELVRRRLESEGATAAEIEKALAIVETIEALEAEAEAQEKARKAEERRIDQALTQIDEVREANRRIREEARRRATQFQSQLQLAEIQEEVRQAERAAQAISQAITDPLIDVVTQTESVADAFQSMVDGILRELARLALQELVGDFVIDLVRGALVDVTAAPGPPDLEGVESFQRGGSFEVGGTGGPDSQLVQFAATPGEEVTVRTRQQQGRGGDTVNSKVEMTVVANDTRGFDRLLEMRQGLLVKLVSQGLKEGMG